jgi:glycosyltransferase involved in cell wall biosynthesis
LIPQIGLVSIIVPCYNAERFLAETLNSALNQTYAPTEIIAIEDGSTDGTAKLLRAYSNRVKAEFGPNRGASAARNRGTALACGEFVQYLDSDDLLVPDAVERRVAALNENCADVAYSDWERLVEIAPNVFEVGERIGRKIEDVDPRPEVARLSFWAPPAALMYRRSIVEKIGEWKDWLPVIQDARFLQDAGLVGGKFVHVPGIGASYRVHTDASLSRRSQTAFVSDAFRNGCDLQSIFEARGGPNANERWVLSNIYNYAARSLFFEDRAAFRDCVKRLYYIDPNFGAKWPKIADRAAKLVGFKLTGIGLRAIARLRRFIH